MVTKASLSHVASRVISRMCSNTILKKKIRSLVLNLTCSSFKQDNFTIVALSDSVGKVLGAGAAKRLPTDSDDDAIGYNLALVRAVKSVVTSVLA